MLAIGGAGITATAASAQAPAPAASMLTAAASPTDLGPNVTVFDPSMPVAQIKQQVDAITARQIDDEMGTNRYALLFKPGTYGSPGQPLELQVGYYMDIAGLGKNPTDVVINGRIDVFNRCLPHPTNPGQSYCVALNNFWRSLSNLSNTGAGGPTECRRTAMFWAASQASPMRRVNINGPLSLMDYCTDQPQWASGGYIADSKVPAQVTNGSQQQYLVRNSTVGGWSNGVWNQVFLGTVGAPATNFGVPQADGRLGTYTNLPTTALSREKPYLYVDSAGAYQVFVPSARTNSAGVSWDNGGTPGRSVPLSQFFVATPSDSVATINAALGAGKNLLLTPGVYGIGQSITVTRADTVVLGMGLATLTAVNGAVPLTVADVPGVIVAGVMIDAGTVTSPALMTVGTSGGTCAACTLSDPTTLSDVFMRVGGPGVGKTTNGLVVNSDDVLIDHIWLWRGDHGKPNTVGWDVSPGDVGLIVNGDNVTGTGLFVEHWRKYNTIWNGDNGKVVFYQNELPYDPPSQQAWRSDALGYAAYKVADSVNTHELWGGGAYIYTNVDPSIHLSHAFEVPVKSGVRLHHLLTVQLLAGIIDHVVNDTGDPTPYPATEPAMVIEYPGSGVPPTSPPTTPPTTTRPTTTPPTSTPPTSTPPTSTPPTSTPTTSTPTTSTPTTSTPTTSTPTTSTPAGGQGPTNLRITTGPDSATLTWDGAPGATYEILRGEAGVRIASTTGNTFTDSGLARSVPYVYSVRGPGGTTQQITVILGSTPTTSTPATSTPTTANPTSTTPTSGSGAAPRNLRAAGTTASTITLAWDGDPNTTYDVLRGEAGDRIATVKGTSFTDIGLLANTPYVYSIRGAGQTTPQVTLRIR
ncbi:hypothetical protein [Nakamurella sp.]|uniref:hypothetical protein n=1 Tax=Nakamurella sp. TaxID=1869182 RepID=UPI003B3B22DC